jgi:hypothetical protein
MRGHAAFVLVLLGLCAEASLAVAAPRTTPVVAPRGRPQIHVNRLSLPSELPRARHWSKELRKLIVREGRRAQWGAGRASTISLRFDVSELSIVEEDGVLRVSCRAIGRLPSGRSAKSQLSFGGEPGKRDAAVERVLRIVVHGVVTRLAELERERRSGESRARVRPPTVVPE